MGHLKTEHRLQENDLMGAPSPAINTSLDATGWHGKKFMEQLIQDVLFCFFKGSPFSVPRAWIRKRIAS